MFEVCEDPSVIAFPGRHGLDRRRRPLAGAAELPTTDLAMWLTARADTYQNVALDPATADSDPVGRWLDQSGNGRNASSLMDGNRPLLKLNQIDGQPGVLADGTDDYLSIFGGLSLGECTVVVVCKRQAGEYMVPLGNSMTEDILTVWFNDFVYAAAQPADDYRARAYTGSTGSVKFRWRRASGGVWNFRATGMAEAVLDDPAATANGTLSLDAVFARTSYAPGFTENVIAEILVWTRDLDSSELAQVDAYLSTYYPSVTW